MPTAIEFNHVSKQYRLGLVSTKTLSHDLDRWWKVNILGKEDPYLKIGDTNDRSIKGESDYVWALKDIDFKVEQGDVVGIIGKNGAGKSTLLKLLSKVTGPTTGTIKARGRIGALLEVGTGFHQEMTGRENIYLNGAILGMSRQEITKKLDEIVDFSGCERYIDTPVKRYSSGMMVRLGFAVAAHLDPEILVVDEVLAVGDAEFQKKAIGKMQDVSQGEGRTVLFVSHNMTSVKQLCTKGVLLENGSVSYIGSAINTIENYLSINTNIIDSKIPVNERIDRFGNGKLKINNISFVNKEGGEISELFVGDYLKIILGFTKTDYINTSQLIVSCGFEDNYGNRVNEWVSDEMEHDFTDLKGNCFSIEIPNMYFRPNHYYFFYKIMNKSTEDKNICDSMHFAKSLNIISDSFYSSNFVLKSGRGYEAVIPAHYCDKH